MKEIFISYSTMDASQAETVRNVLEKNGLSCWMAPRDIPGGSNYTKEIPIAIRNCKIFLLILSSNAQNSHWVLKELDSAVNNGKVILPFMLDDCSLSDEFNFLLTGAQRYSAYQKTAEAMELLIGRIRSILDVPAAPVEKTPDAQTPGQEAPVQEKSGKKKPAQEKSDPQLPNPAVCPSCGGTDLKPLPKRMLRKGLWECSTMLLIPVMGCLLALIGMLLYSPFLILVGFVGGCLWGNHMSRKIVHRRRIRSRITYACYRCKACDRKFRIDTPNN